MQGLAHSGLLQRGYELCCLREKHAQSDQRCHRRTVFQGVHNMWQFSSGEEHQKRGSGEKPLNQLVFIGKHLDRAGLVSSLTACQLSIA